VIKYLITFREYDWIYDDVPYSCDQQTIIEAVSDAAARTKLYEGIGNVQVINVKILGL
jgi:hypothetical protein